MSRAFAGFAQGFMGGVEMNARRAALEGVRGQGIAPEDKAQSENANGLAVDQATAENGYKTKGVVSKDLKPHQAAFLDSLSDGESGGDYNVRYGGPNGPQQFEGFAQHPNILEDGPHGKSSAAGRYQFTGSTWNDMGGGAFTPENQDNRAWQLATQRYKASTGRDLDGDLQARGMGADIMSPLGTTWEALKTGQDKHAALYQERLKFYNGAGGGEAAPSEPAMKPSRSIIETMGRNAKANIQAARDNIGSFSDNWAALRALGS